MTILNTAADDTSAVGSADAARRIAFGDAPVHAPAAGQPEHQTSTAASVALMLATVLSGLFAGFFLTYSASVQLGLARVDALTYVRTFQEINATIRNPVFAVFFFGCVPAIALALAFHRHGPRRRMVLLAAGAVACTAVVAITFAFSVPLNNELATYVDPTIDEARVARDGFESVWNRWNLARSILSVIGASSVAATAIPFRRR